MSHIEVRTVEPLGWMPPRSYNVGGFFIQLENLLLTTNRMIKAESLYCVAFIISNQLNLLKNQLWLVKYILYIFHFLKLESMISIIYSMHIQIFYFSNKVKVFLIYKIIESMRIETISDILDILTFRNSAHLIIHCLGNISGLRNYIFLLILAFLKECSTVFIF